MRIKKEPLLAVFIVFVVTFAGAAPILATTVAAQGNGDGMHGSGPGPGPNVTAGQHQNGSHSMRVENVGANQTIRVQFRYRADSPDVGVRMREMAVRTNRSGDYQFALRTAANASAGVGAFSGPAPFGYFNITHQFPNENVTNASMTFAVNRTRLRERNVSAERVALYRYNAQNRSWNRLQTRVTERNATQVAFRAESPGLSEFAVAPIADASTATVTVTEETTPTNTPGFGPGLAVLALVVFASRLWLN